MIRDLLRKVSSLLRKIATAVVALALFVLVLVLGIIFILIKLIPWAIRLATALVWLIGMYQLLVASYATYSQSAVAQMQVFFICAAFVILPLLSPILVPEKYVWGALLFSGCVCFGLGYFISLIDMFVSVVLPLAMLFVSVMFVAVKKRRQYGSENA